MTEMIKPLLYLLTAMIASSITATVHAAEIIHEDFTDPAWRDSFFTLFNNANYPLMVDGVNGWTVKQGPFLPSGFAIKTRTDTLQFVNSGWEHGTQSPSGGNPVGLSRSDLPNLVGGDFRFGWRDGAGGRGFWEVKIKDAAGNVAATVRHDTVAGNGFGNQITVNGTPFTDPASYAAADHWPAFVTARWNIQVNSVTVSLLDGPNGEEQSLGLTETIQNGAGPITTFEFTTGNSGNGDGGGIEMVGSILGGQNDFGAGVINGLVINGIIIPHIDEATVTDTIATEFLSDNGAPYVLQYTTDLVTSNNWTNADVSVTGNGTNMFLFDPSGYSTAKLYRVVCNPL
jgi:hypothetical protein